MTPEEIEAEIKKCRDNPVYMFNTYLRRPDQPEMTAENYNGCVMASYFAGLKLRRAPSESFRQKVFDHLKSIGKLI